MTLGDRARGIRPTRQEAPAAAMPRHIAHIATDPFRSADRPMVSRSTPTDDALFEQATRWHLCLREASDAATWQAYQQWLASDPRHVLAIAEAEKLLGMLSEPAADLAQQVSSVQAASPLPPHRRRRRRWVGYAIAASVLLAVGAFWLGHHDYDRLRGDTVTTVGELRVLQLDDGSTITLNTDTALRVTYGAQERHVRLDRGEAYFQVAHQPSRPFIVDTPAGRAKVLGTVFDVRSETDRTRVAVAEGHVAVSAAGGGDTVLSAGQSVWLSKAGWQPGSERDADPTAAWRRGQLVFFRTPLADVVASLDRYRHGKVYLRGDALRQLPVSGSFDTRHPDATLDLLLSTLHLRTVRLGPWITVVYRG